TGGKEQSKVFTFPIHLQLWTDRCEWSGVRGGSWDDLSEAEVKVKEQRVKEEQMLVNAALTSIWKAWQVKQMSCNVFPVSHGKELRETWEMEKVPVQRFAVL